MDNLGNDPDVRALYREPPERFVTARDALVRSRRDAGDAAAAASIKALRKPTVPAWALDQLADRDPHGVEALLEAGAELRAAQRAAVSSTEHAGRLREATTARRAAVAALADLASRTLTDAGRPPGPHLEDVVATLEAASVNDAAAALLRTGTFDRPMRDTVGFGDVFGLQAVPDLVPDNDDEAEAPTAGPAPPATEPEPPSAATRRDRAELQAEASRLRRDRQGAERRARKAREAADRLAAEAEAMRARLDVVESKRRDAERAARSAERDAAEAVDAHDRARAEAEALDA